MDEKLKELVEFGIKFHGHKCPAMPLGIRAGLLALKLLGVERAKDKELYCQLETGPAHAMLCFGDGVQVSTGCTFGKGNIERLNYSKVGLILIDVKNQRAVRVGLNPEFHKKALGSEFVKLREKGVPPQDISPEVVDPLVERVLSLPDEQIFRTAGPFAYEFKPRKGTFEWIECQGCGEVIFAHGVRIADGKTVCVVCGNYEPHPLAESKT